MRYLATVRKLGKEWPVKFKAENDNQAQQRAAKFGMVVSVKQIPG